MLVPAIEYKEQLEDVWMEYVHHPDFLFWDVPTQFSLTPDIYKEWRKEEYVCINDKKELIGYVAIWVDKSTSSVSDISLAQFKNDDKTFGWDFLKFLRDCRRRFRCVRFACIKGHPMERDYDRLAYMWGGRVVGVFEKKRRLLDGKLYDEKWYEVPKENPRRKAPSS